jgi:hypothetical protein
MTSTPDLQVPVNPGYPPHGPDDKPEDVTDLYRHLAGTWAIWYSDKWRSHSIEGDGFFGPPPTAETAIELRDKIEAKMARKIPDIRQFLEAAEAAAERLSARTHS